MNIPEPYNAVMPYLIVKDAKAFLQFLIDVFTARQLNVHYRDENNSEIIMHAEADMNGSIIMLAEATEQYQVQNAGLFIYVENADETYNKALAKGAVVVTPLADQQYGRSGGVKDSFGNVWWITSA